LLEIARAGLGEGAYAKAPTALPNAHETPFLKIALAPEKPSRARRPARIICKVPEPALDQ
jgi:hypothetical protein